MELELRDYLRILSKRWWLVLLALVGCVGGALFVTAKATPTYEATAKLFVGKQQIATTDITTGQTVNQLSFQLLESYAEIIRTRPIAEKAVEREGLPIPPMELAASIEAQPILDTQIIKVRYVSDDPTLAQRTVNAVTRAFVDEIEEIEAPTQQSDEPAVNVTVIEPALRLDTPIAPRPIRNLSLAIVLGLMLGVGIAFVVEYFDTTVKSREDVEAAGLPVLAGVPQLKVGDSEVYLERDLQSVGAESFRKLRTAVQFLGVDQPIRSLLVTSPLAQEGKTTTAFNLAAAFAKAGVRTLLVEADLRRPTAHTVFAVDRWRGLTSVLVGRISPESAVQNGLVRGLSLLPAGPLPPNPAELLASEHMTETLERLRSQADLVIIDSPPLLPVSDASPLVAQVDGVVLVARRGKTNRARLNEAADLVHRAGGRLLGVVVNRLKVGDSAPEYEYYGYRSRKEGSKIDQIPRASTLGG